MLRLSHILVATSGKADEDEQLRVLLRELQRMGKGMCRLEGADDPFGFGKQPERLKRLVISRCNILRATAFLQMRVLRPDRGIVEPRRDRPAVRDLPVLVLQ